MSKRVRPLIRIRECDSPQLLIMKSISEIRETFSILQEFSSFLRARKKWRLEAIVILLLTLGVVMVLTEGSVLAPIHS